jgi:hypothetical protein
VLVARLALLGTAAVAVSVAVAVAWPAARKREPLATGYVCPMHPEVTSTDPGACPICGMALTPITSRANAPLDEVVLAMTPHPQTVHQPAMTAIVRRVTLPSPTHLPAFVDDEGRAVALMDGQQIASMEASEVGTFVRAAAAPVTARRASLRPELWDDGFSRVTFDLDAALEGPAAGAVGWLELHERARPALVIPLHAIIDSPRGPYVLISSPDRRTYRRRFVRLGGVRGAYAAVAAGLSEGERVAVAGAWFLDAERRLRGGEP